MNEITQLLHIDPLLLQALREDIPEEDVSTNAVMPHACPGTVDLIAKEEIAAYLTAYKRQGGTILITTHEEQELKLCDRLLILKDGKLTEADPSLRGVPLVSKF